MSRRNVPSLSLRPARLALLGLVLAFAATAAPMLRAYTKFGYTWLAGDIPMTLELGTPTSPLSDGSTSWNAPAEASLADWNNQLGRIRFTSTRATTTEVPPADQDHANNVFFSDNYYGLAFDARTLAITLPFVLDEVYVTADVVVNNKIQWDSYRGTLHTSASGATIYDLRRVVLHEFGHVLGLGHPDQATPAQNVVAIMNANISALDALTTDDIGGVKTLYSPNSVMTITTNPQSQTKTTGTPVTFTAAGTGLGGTTITYTWMLTRPGGVPERLENSHTASYTLKCVQPSDAGIYQCVVANSDGAALTTGATLTVTPLTPVAGTRLANLSTRSPVGTGADILIAGFAITGTTPKTVLIRAAGPALAAYGVTGTLADPQLKLFKADGTVIQQNDNWDAVAAEGTATAAVAARVGAFAFTAGSKDAALVATLPPGSYTAQVNGAANGTGVALVEVYDADPDDATALTRKLVNLSSRSRVGTGSNIMIAGFAVNGPGPRKFLIRATGGTLTSLGVSGALGDTLLELLADDGSSLRTDDDRDTPYSVQPELEAASALVGAFPQQARTDSAMIVTLQPGRYTAQASGFGKATGVALVEIYEMP